MIDANFIRNRITQLRLQKGVSEYQMGYDLGHSRSYVYNISSGAADRIFGDMQLFRYNAESVF